MGTLRNLGLFQDMCPGARPGNAGRRRKSGHFPKRNWCSFMKEMSTLGQSELLEQRGYANGSAAATYAPISSVWEGSDGDLLEMMFAFYARIPPEPILDATSGRYV